MIDVQAKIHDQYTIELKVGYVARQKMPRSDFVMNTWMFIPDSLDINRRTYPKELFYKDVHSHMRLITPIFQLADMAKENNMPFLLLKSEYLKTSSNASEKALKNFESQVKMYASIYKSAIRNAYEKIYLERANDHLQQAKNLISSVSSVLLQFRSLQQYVEKSINVPIDGYYRCADEFISNVTEQHLFLLANYLKGNQQAIWVHVKKELFALLDKELAYKKKKGYISVKADDDDNNREFVHNAGLLKKYAESNLYLKAQKRHNTFFIEQVAFMFAAGISMTFATVIAFSFQRTFGNFTLPLFIALVVSYMFKDRIKELIRYYFAYKMGSKFFDYKIIMSIHERELGWCKEGFDYITSNKLPQQVKEKRGRTSLLETRRGIDEQIMLYRKKVHLNKANINRINHYPFIGVNDIIRINLFEFMRKMDNPSVPVFVSLGGEEFDSVKAPKVYYINYIIQCRYQGITTDYYRYRVMIGREGIQKIDKIV